jgi:ABC-type transport system involved in multi-copper enzyme maturation permease subunit
MGWPVIRRAKASESQTWIIAEKEIAENVRNFKIPAAFSLLTALILLSFFLMSLDYQKRLDNWSTNRAAQSDKLFSGIIANYRSADNQMSMRATSVQSEPLIRKPMMMSVLAKGLDSLMERSVAVGEHASIPPAVGFTFGATQERNRNVMTAAAPDFLFIIKIIVSLLALFFAYDAIAGEKEMGTLRAMLSGPVRRRTVLIGKWIGASLSLAVPFLLAVLIGLVYLKAVRGFSFEGAEWARITLIFAASVLYGLVFISLGLLISARSSTRKQSIAVALACWVLLALVLPSVTVLVAERLRPVPTLAEHNASVVPLARQIESEVAANGSEDGFEFPGYGMHYQSAASRIRQIARQADNDYLARKLDRDRLARRLARLSPAGAFSYAVTDLAGTGLGEFQSYIGKLQRARDRQIELAEEKQNAISLSISTEEEQRKANEKLAEFFEKAKQLNRDLYESLVVMRSPQEAITDALPDLAALVVWSALMLAAAAMVFNRADVR